MNTKIDRLVDSMLSGSEPDLQDLSVMSRVAIKNISIIRKHLEDIRPLFLKEYQDGSRYTFTFKSSNFKFGGCWIDIGNKDIECWNEHWKTTVFKNPKKVLDWINQVS